MNTFRQLKLKLQMGIDPAVEISSTLLRDMWQQLLAERTARGMAIPERGFQQQREVLAQENLTAE